MSTKYILFVIGSLNQSTEALHWCLHKSKETQRPVRVVYALEDSNQEAAVKKILAEIDKQGTTFAVKLETRLVAGNFLEVCEKEAAESDVDLLVIPNEKKSLFKKFLGGKNIDLGNITCPVKVYG